MQLGRTLWLLFFFQSIPGTMGCQAQTAKLIHDRKIVSFSPGPTGHPGTVQSSSDSERSLRGCSGNHAKGKERTAVNASGFSEKVVRTRCDTSLDSVYPVGELKSSSKYCWLSSQNAELFCDQIDARTNILTIDSTECPEKKIPNKMSQGKLDLLWYPTTIRWYTGQENCCQWLWWLFKLLNC